MKFTEFIPSEKRREWDFLLSGIQAFGLPGYSRRFEDQCKDGTDWDFIIQKALENGVTLLFFQNLKKNCPRSIPAPYFDRLSRIFKYNAGRNLSLTAGLLSTIKLLQQERILSVPFKGPSLSEFLYGDAILRSFVDVDILVHPKDALKAARLIEKQGYTPSVLLDDRQFNAYMETEYSIELCGKQGRATIELHWELGGRYTTHPFTLASFENRLEQKSLIGKATDQFPPEELLVYLCVHGSKDGWNRLESILLLTALISKHPDMDWKHVIRLTQKLRCKRMLFLGLFLANDIFEAPLPGLISRKLEADPGIQKLAKRICEAIFSNHAHRSRSFGQFDFSSFHFDIRDNFPEKIRHLLRLLFQPTRQEWRYFPLPSYLAFFHRALRPMRLMWEYGTSRF